MFFYFVQRVQFSSLFFFENVSHILYIQRRLRIGISYYLLPDLIQMCTILSFEQCGKWEHQWRQPICILIQYNRITW